MQTLKSSAIHGSEWVGPWLDMALGLHTAASYYYYPGFHEPGTNIAEVKTTSDKAIPVCIDQVAGDVFSQSNTRSRQRELPCSRTPERDFRSAQYRPHIQAISGQEPVTLGGSPDISAHTSFEINCERILHGLTTKEVHEVAARVALIRIM
jgi:hypothetical protein